MTIKELMDELEYAIQMGRGDFTVVAWDTSRVKAIDTIWDSDKKEFYICTEN
jgi:hypothetical protein